MKYQEIKAAREAKQSELFTACRLFFAFSNKQFEEGKTPKAEGEKYVHIGAGGYLPKSQVDNFINGMEALNKWERAEIKRHKQADEEIRFELANHECYYTGDPSTVIELLPNYDPQRIINVFNTERKKHY